MGKFVTMDTPGGLIWVEVDDLEGESEDIVLVSKQLDKASESFKDAVGSFRENAKFLMDSLESLAPGEVEITFGIKAGIEGGTPFFGLAKASTEGSYNVKMKWNNDVPQKN